jgi:hypothetical protein
MHIIQKRRNRRDGKKPLLTYVGIYNADTGERRPLCGSALAAYTVVDENGDMGMVTCKHCLRAISWRRKRLLVRVVNLRYDAHFSQRDKVVVNA